MKIFIFYFTVLFLCFACNNKKTENEASDKLAEIEQLISAEKYNAAKIAIDSFHVNFAQMINLRRKVLALEDTIFTSQNRRTISYCDSMLAVTNKKLDSLQNFFRFEKDKKYQFFGSYVFKNQVLNADMGNSFWTYTDENNDFFLTKNLFDAIKPNEIFFTVSFGDVFVSTDTIPANSPARNKFEILGHSVETVIFKNEQIEKFAAFVNQFSDKTLTVKFGKSGKHNLSTNEKRSISITYQFWKLKKEIENLKMQRAKAVKKSTAVLSP